MHFLSFFFKKNKSQIGYSAFITFVFISYLIFEKKKKKALKDFSLGFLIKTMCCVDCFSARLYGICLQLFQEHKSHHVSVPMSFIIDQTAPLFSFFFRALLPLHVPCSL